MQSQRVHMATEESITNLTDMDHLHTSHNRTITNSMVLSINWNISFIDNTTLISRWNITLLRTLSDDMFLRLLPTVAVLVAIMIVGTVGNLFICYIFLMKLRTSSQNFLLLCLGLFDLISSCVGVPSEIFDVRHYYLYESANTCKAMRFITTFPSLASILVLLIIAADRYRKVVKPLYYQIQVSTARIVVAIIVIFCLLLSVPAVYIYGHRTLPTTMTGEYGYDCSINDAYKDSYYPVIYEGLFCAAFVVCTFALVFIYVRIWVETKRHIQYMQNNAIWGPLMVDETPTSSTNYDDSTMESNDDSMLKQGSVTLSLKSTIRDLFCRRLVGKGKGNSETLPSIENISKTELSNVRNTHKVEVNQIKIVSGFHKERNRDFNYCVLNKNCDVDNNININNRLSEIIELAVLNRKVNTPKELTYYFPGSTCGPADNVSDYTAPYNAYGDICISERTASLESCNYSICSDIHCQEFVTNEQVSNISRSCTLRHVPKKQDIKCLESNFVHEVDSRNDLNIVPTRTHDLHLSLHVNSDNRICAQSEHGTKTSHPNDKSPSLSDSAIDITTNSIDNRTVEPSILLQQNTQTKSLEQNQHKLNTDDLCNVHTTDSLSHSNTLQRKLNVSKQDTDISTRQMGKVESVNSSDTENECDGKSCYHITHYQPNSFEYQLTNKENSAIFTTSNVSSRRVSFATDLNDFACTSQVNDSHNMQLSLDNETGTTQSHKVLVKTRSSQSLVAAKNARKALRTTRATIIAFVITLGFILSFLPHLILIMLRSATINLEEQSDNISLNMYNIFLRSYFVNNIVNIFVYAFMHLEFRTQISNMWTGITNMKGSVQ